MASIRSCLIGTPLGMRPKSKASSSGNAVPRGKEELSSGIVTDSRGQQRFHGAFHGGFSAGYFNTVGSVEGFQPSSFVSSRKEKARRQQSRPEDFMDEEDLREFSVAGKGIRAKDEFAGMGSTEEELRRRADKNEIAPGIQVVAVDRSIGIRLLQRMGWARGEPIGGRHSNKPVQETPQLHRQRHDASHGLGYDPELDPSIKPQLPKGARPSEYGLSALEEAGRYDDIYATDSMDQYDTALSVSMKDSTSEKDAPVRQQKASDSCLQRCSDGTKCLAGFVLTLAVKSTAPSGPRLKVPADFVPVHIFSSGDLQLNAHLERFRPALVQAIARRGHHLTASDRAVALGERVLPSKPVSVFEMISDDDRKRLSASLAKNFSVGSTLRPGGTTLESEKVESRADVPKDYDSAARMNMFGKLTREEMQFKPPRLLCKRFNVPDPYQGLPEVTQEVHTRRDRFQELLSSVGIEPPQAPAAPLQLSDGVEAEPVSDDDYDDNTSTAVEAVKVEKPPTDLFKAIFEDDDSDDSDSEDADDKVSSMRTPPPPPQLRSGLIDQPRPPPPPRSPPKHGPIGPMFRPSQQPLPPPPSQQPLPPPPSQQPPPPPLPPPPSAKPLVYRPSNAVGVPSAQLDALLATRNEPSSSRRHERCSHKRSRSRSQSPKRRQRHRSRSMSPRKKTHRGSRPRSRSRSKSARRDRRSSSKRHKRKNGKEGKDEVDNADEKLIRKLAKKLKKKKHRK